MNDTDHSVSLRTPRLFVHAVLSPDAALALGPEQTHYLLRVMRLRPGAEVNVFNGRDGLWRAELQGGDRRRIGVRAERQIAPQPPTVGPWLAFGVPKRSALEALVQKGTELGTIRFLPIASARAMADRLNPGRLEKIAIEAAEQCERLNVPLIEPVRRLEELLAAWPAERTLLWCDEHGHGQPLADVADMLLGDDPDQPPPPWGLMIGPEGGFTADELDALREVPFVRRVTLGPRIMRVDTAAVAALAIGQALAGDGDLQVRQEI